MALENQEQVEALADKMMGCADSIHDRLMKAIKNREIDRDAAQLLFQDESILRQRANGLYVDAANCVVAGLAESQKSLLDMIDTAQEKIKAIERIAGFIDFVADLLVLASAAYAAKPALIAAALEELKNDVDALREEA